MHHLLPRTRAFLVAMLIPALVSCGGDSPSTPKDEGGNQPVELSISFAVSSALPGEEVDISGIPASVDLGGVYAVVRDVVATRVAVGAPAQQAAEDTVTTLVARRSDGTPYLVAPLRPSDLVNGGTVGLHLEGGGVTSNEVLFEIRALPAATVSVQDLVDGLQALLTSWLEAHGTTREELRSMDVASMPALFYPLWHAQEILDSPDNPNSMRALVDGPIPFFDNEVMDFDVANRLLSLTGAVPFLADEVTSVDSLATQDVLEAISLAQSASPEHGQPTRLSVTALDCIPSGDYGITTASQLDIAMTQARAAASRLEGFTGDVLSYWSDTARALGMIPQLKAGATVASGGLYVFKLVNEAAAKLLPTSFDYEATVLTLADNDSTYNEDDTGGFWERFDITGVSQGWVLDQDALEAALKVGKFSDLGGTNQNPFVGSLHEFKNRFWSYIITEGTKFIIREVTNGTEGLEVCPGRWPDIDASSSLYSKSEISFGTSFEMSSHTFFETREPGVSQLKVQTRDEDRFGGTPPTAERRELTVVRIGVEVIPSQAVMMPNEVQVFDAIVTNASNDSVDWIVPAPLVEVNRENFGKSIYVQAPPATVEWTMPVSLYARSRAHNGSRAGKINSDPRENAALILPQADTVLVEVFPSDVCLSPGDTLRFQAVVTGLFDQSVTWSTDPSNAGSFSGNLYTAPNTEVGPVTIIATSVGSPTAQGSVQISVAGCECSWIAIITGDQSFAWGGTSATFEDVFGVATTFTFETVVEGPLEAHYPKITASIDVPFVPGRTGTWPLLGEIRATLTDVGWSPGDPDNNELMPELIILFNDGETVKGQINGPFARPLDGNVGWETINLHLEFTATDKAKALCRD